MDELAYPDDFGAEDALRELRAASPEFDWKVCPTSILYVDPDLTRWERPR